MSNGLDTRPSLIVGLQQPRNAAAFARFCTLYTPFVYAIAFRLCQQEADALDLTQEVLLRVFEKIGTFNPEVSRSGFRAWLATITRNLHVDSLRRKRDGNSGSGDSGVRELLTEVPAPSGFSESQYEEYARQHRDALNRARDKFPAWYAEAYLRLEFLLETEAEVATEFKQSVEVVRTARTRIKAEVEREFTRTCMGD